MKTSVSSAATLFTIVLAVPGKSPDAAEGWISHCRALPGAGTFFDIRGPANRRLRFTENDLAMASRPFSVDDTIRKAVTIDPAE